MNEIINAFKTAYPQKSKNDQPDTPMVAQDVENNQNTDTTSINESVTSSNYTFDISDFNEKYGKHFGREIKEEKELNDLFSAPSKTTEWENKFKELESSHTLTKKELEDLRTEYESQKENLKFIDLKKYFANENLYKTNQLKLKYPDRDESIMADIVNTDLNKINAVDLLVKKAKFDDYDIYGQMDDTAIKEVIASDFNNVDLNDPESWDNITKAKIAKAAKQAKNELEVLQKIELPIPIDIEKEKEIVFSKERNRIEESKNQWNPIVEKMVADFKELIIPDETGKELYKYSPELNDSFKKEINQMVDYLAYTGQPINEQTITDVLESIKGKYIIRELPKILKSHALKVSTQVNDEWHQKIHNDVPLSENTRPASEKEQIWSKMAAMI